VWLYLSRQAEGALEQLLCDQEMAMLWFCLAFTLVSALAFAFKAYVIWDVSHDVYGGGGVPTIDYFILYPIFIAVGCSTFLRILGATPFPFFGFALYGALLTLSIFIYWLFDRLGKPIREAQLRRIRSDSESHDSKM
jgi:hypothetical protein